MIQDTMTVLWKEAVELARSARKPSSLMGMVFYLIFFGVFPVSVIGRMFAASPLAFSFWIILPVLVGSGVAINAFAGERERHTLETLLATRLPDRAILAGKLAAGVLYSVIYLVLAMLAGLLTLNLFYGEGQLIGYTPAIAAGGLILGVLVAAAMSAAGVLVSLQAATVREAGQRLALLMMLLFFPYFGLSFVPLEQRAAIIQLVGGVNTWLIVLVASVLLMVVLGVLLVLLIRQFQRARLLLDPSPTSPTPHTSSDGARGRTREQATSARPSPRFRIPAPLADVLTMIWKEWKELRHSDGRNTGRRMLIVGIVLIGVILPLQGGREWVTEGEALFAWLLVPTVLVMRTIADSFAGERERHTLETLLATPLSDQVILTGKLLTPLLWAWGTTQGLILVSLITANIAFGEGSLLLFSPSTLMVGSGFGLLISGMVAAAGVLLSLRAESVRQAQQTLAIAWFVLIVIYVVLTILVMVVLEYVGLDLAAWLEAGRVAPLVWGAAGVLTLLDGLILLLALRRFRRARLLLV